MDANTISKIILKSSMEDIRSLCQTHPVFYNFCNKYPQFWKELIYKDFLQVFDYDDRKLDTAIQNIFNCVGNACYNYNVYTILIKNLPCITRLRVYLNMNDFDTFYNTCSYNNEAHYIALAINLLSEPSNKDYLNMLYHFNAQPAILRFFSYLKGEIELPDKTRQLVLSNKNIRNDPYVTEFVLNKLSS